MVTENPIGYFLASPKAYNNRGAAYDGLKQYERAIEDYNKAIELNPNDACAYNNRELAREKLKEQKTTQTPTVSPVPLTPTLMPTPSPAATATKIPTPKVKGVPGFEVILAIMGLLAVAYLLRRKG